jgi:homoserine O-acetyltransferase/O-succinyltransferase
MRCHWIARCIVTMWLMTAAVAAHAQTGIPVSSEGDFMVRDFVFASGETLPELRLHYRTVGTPRKDASGTVTNGVLMLHGTGDSGAGFVDSRFADQVFGKGAVLDADRYYVILPDNIGHGRSSKPSDGLRAKFPNYRYTDMVRLQHRLVTDGLGLTRLRLVMGMSMGGMHTWMWGYMFPTFADALFPLASNPVEIAGRNRGWRKVLIDAITRDPAWKGGDYVDQPPGLRTAAGILAIVLYSPLQLQKDLPTREAADRGLEMHLAEEVQRRDANDLLYAFRASEDYDPSPHLEKIVSPLLAVNSADDFVNPPELATMQTHITRVKRGEFVLVPTSETTIGHATCGLPQVFGPHLRRLLERD